ncbi:UDP-N-acetylmuramoyl-L-alanine--D-glutamate ligase [Methylocystis bryophila]|uniref:UDP-N-acetylmuramoylalanine--D-glutamate ligase n=1 Tax=Methylocystis bryophila TaxID=655015 RepID=A0A1W6MRB7_9HYPH|nr:UDP-N-acetylmuramoyl-L-alanine--D-glutamate ligase [Methylocystis bryophila]ARN80151.1 UDP-N-acetylmuramoyl-L-alanine--D-glutamate ligase [Methylocystis bryophila]BDV40092.1 UDP-N-acetylmuramoylalanine--D-glutamate ligase [Methylocystis bryophila]
MPISAQAKSIAIWGAGREGAAALAYIKTHRPDAAITVLNDSPLSAAALAALEGASVLIGAEAASALSAGMFDVVIKSPGVSPYRPEVETAKQRGVDFTSVTNLWFEENPKAKTIAVTGTKGKTTTSGLIHHMLRAAGLDASLIGNGGVPALAQKTAHDVTVLELSSYQTADLKHAPTIAVITSLYPEHAPWHGGVERYYADKLRLAQLDEKTLLVANGADARLRTAFASRPNTLWYNAGDGFRVEDGKLLKEAAPFAHEHFPLRGAHNLSNLAAALTLVEHLGLDAAACETTLADFAIPPHRLSEFDVDGVLCVDDSISTIPEATLAALKTFADHPFCLILGGEDRGQNYAELYAYLKMRPPRFVALMPANGKRILDELSPLAPSFEFQLMENLRQAVDACFQRLQKGDLLLLSPAAPSYGQFANFEERGRVFEELCRAKAGK